MMKRALRAGLAMLALLASLGTAPRANTFGFAVLKVPGINGESQQPRYQGWNDLLTFSFGAKGAQYGGSAAQPLEFTKTVDGTSAAFAAHYRSGQKFNGTSFLEFVTHVRTIEVRIENATVERYEQTVKSGEPATETIALAYTKIDYCWETTCVTAISRKSIPGARP